MTKWRSRAKLKSMSERKLIRWPRELSTSLKYSWINHYCGTTHLLFTVQLWFSNIPYSIIRLYATLHSLYSTHLSSLLLFISPNRFSWVLFLTSPTLMSFCTPLYSTLDSLLSTTLLYSPVLASAGHLFYSLLLSSVSYLSYPNVILYLSLLYSPRVSTITFCSTLPFYFSLLTFLRLSYTPPIVFTNLFPILIHTLLYSTILFYSTTLLHHSILL